MTPLKETFPRGYKGEIMSQNFKSESFNYDIKDLINK